MEATRYTHEPNTKDRQALYREVMSYFASSRVKSFGERERKGDKSEPEYIREENSKAEWGWGQRSEGIADLVG